MSEIRLKKIKVKNYRSFGEEQTFDFPENDYNKPISIIGYNNSGKTNLMNAIMYGIGENFVSAKTFEKTDLHNLNLANQLEIKTRIEATPYGHNYYGPQTIAGDYTIKTTLEDNEIKSSISKSFFGANKHYNIFYINFHNIKEEISTKKTSWGNLTSFLAKHIKSIVDNDAGMIAKKEAFKNSTKEATEEVLNDSQLSNFISKIKENYAQNLRNNNCEVEFGLPDYEDIFLQMVFKIGLNGEINNLIPIDHFGDGYISMFVMAVIQAIAESNIDDKCLFLFEEPESFLHENHQEYFYKMVLCSLAEKGHQVIYTTHSDKMIDIFDTKSIIRIDFDEQEKRTVKKYNNIEDFDSQNEEIISIENFNSFIKSVEPNINKTLFSRKVLLVEGPNDLLAYNYAIEKKINDIKNDSKFANTYLNFKNISIVVHHGKATALLLIDLCKHFGIDYYVINDWDFDLDFIEELAVIDTEVELKASQLYLSENGEDRSVTRKGMVTTNWKLIKTADIDKIHFNIPKLENVLGYESDNKSSLGIWERLNEIPEFDNVFFPESLINFLEINELSENNIPEIPIEEANDLPF
ncbi:AAA ATPase-like protein [Tenacibaculum lutimaris]|uniref:AAA ATPase-like protein n=1 Tax=Tenacibaculum lutimaris TaxID=285258 RepID=A0A420E435_9FLAO|nr:AAA family ATPase [Tenacibaculum lutimaris]RKF04842.1 AAA ATPase-like protein [Tenacibaculum lutimaris]